MQENSPAWADENQLKYEKVRFLSKISEINSIWVIFNRQEWTLFKSVETECWIMMNENFLSSDAQNSQQLFWNETTYHNP